jgi:C4-dicarboxylate-specific signal transduction histidine kinase
MIGTLTDITERRETDELSQRLAQASRLAAMGELTASIAHEINQPMSAILANVDAAEMLLDTGQHGSDELRQILQDIRSDDLRASEVIRHIRALANKREIAFVRFDVNELARAVLRLASTTARRRGVALVSRFATVPLVHGDRIHVQQILLNLLFNGMDAVVDMAAGRRRLELSTAQTGARRCRGAHPRLGTWDSGGAMRADLRLVLHDEGAWNGTRPFHRPYAGRSEPAATSPPKTIRTAVPCSASRCGSRRHPRA